MPAALRPRQRFTTEATKGHRGRSFNGKPKATVFDTASNQPMVPASLEMVLDPAHMPFGDVQEKLRFPGSVRSSGIDYHLCLYLSPR
jgi:hypothetical protein